MMGGNIWDRIRSVVLLMEFTSIDEVVAWRNALKSVGLNVNECQIICFIKNKKEREVLKEMNSVIFLAENDRNFLGKIRFEPIKRMLANQYDAALWMNDEPKKMKKILKKLNTQWRIGVNVLDGQFDVKLKTSESNPEQIVNFVKDTLKRIS